MVELLTTCGIAIVLAGLAYCVAALLKVIRGGVVATDAMLRGGVGFRTLREGDVPSQLSGTSLVVREGMRAWIEPDGSVEIKQTRTIARDAL